MGDPLLTPCEVYRRFEAGGGNWNPERIQSELKAVAEGILKEIKEGKLKLYKE